MNDKELQIFKNRLLELSRRSIDKGIFTFTEFLGLAQQSIFHSLKRELYGTACTVFGGAPACERVIVRFGDPSELGYEEPFPISVIRISPSDKNVSKLPGHRDILGALMSLGISRGTMGDIFIDGDEAYIFALESIAPHIRDELISIRHTPVRCEIFEGDVADISPSMEDVSIRVSTERLDAVVSKLFNLSRDKSQALFSQGKVFINGKECTNVHSKPPEGSVISVRGFGRFIYRGAVGTTKKDKLVIGLSLYSR